MKQLVRNAFLLVCTISVSAQNTDWIQQSSPIAKHSIFDGAILNKGLTLAAGDNGKIIISSDGKFAQKKKFKI
jgi:hypothetical protein